jgi:NAD(P)H-hydrate epimerase
VADQKLVREWLPTRPLDAHKGTFGTAMLVAGSVNYTGAALLAGKAAYRSGAGLVTLAVPSSLHLALSGHCRSHLDPPAT